MSAKLLVIDDEKDMVEVIKSALTTRGYDVISAFNGEEGLRKVKLEKPDLVICDIRMPKLDGWGVLKALREDTTSWVPVIMLTVLKEIADVKKGYNYQADYYVTKPFNVKDLLEGVRVILSLRPARSEGANSIGAGDGK